jgi:hypothetical protein
MTVRMKLQQVFIEEEKLSSGSQLRPHSPPFSHTIPVREVVIIYENEDFGHSSSLPN